MDALVTGGAGFIGSAVVRNLLARGASVRVIDDLSSGRAEDVPPGASLIRGDICEPDAVVEVATGVDVIFHLAALRSVARSIDTPLETNRVNVTGTLNVLVAAQRHDVRRVVYASSSSLYGDVDVDRKHEGLAPEPRSPYAVSKLAGEAYCRAWSAMGATETVSLRYFNVFGPGQRADSPYAAVFPLFIAALLENEPPEIHWDGDQSRSFTFIDDVVDATVRAGDADGADGSVINIAGSRSRTINEVCEALKREIGADIDPVYAPKREGDVRHSNADTSRARELLGWEPTTSWEDAVARTVGWFDPSRAE